MNGLTHDFLFFLLFFATQEEEGMYITVEEECANDAAVV